MCATPSPPLLSVPKNSIAAITATNGRIGIMSGSGNSQIWRSGNKIALAIRIPKIAPEAPIVGVSRRLAPEKWNEFHNNRQEPGPHAAQKEIVEEALFAPHQLEFSPKHPQHQHVDEQMKQVAMQKYVGEWLPDAQPGNHAKRNQSELVVDPRRKARDEERE